MSKQIRGRFSKPIESSTLAYTQSLSSDSRLALFDIQGSLAHAQELKRVGVLSAQELRQIQKGLQAIEREIVTEKFNFEIDYEDVHMNIEKALVEKIGATGKKLHTGRSRNDQVITDLKLYLKQTVVDFDKLLINLMKTLIEISEKNITTIMPGYTHLQIAQPVTLAHHLNAYTLMFKRDLARIRNLRTELEKSPLGAAALAGTSYPLDRLRVAKSLGFQTVTENSMDTVADRDYLVDLAQALALVMVHISRLAEELIIWNSSEFNFVTLDDRYTTGSSIMPQKKNPDILELARGRSALVISNLNALLVLIKGLPLTYNRDLQEDKKIIFDSIDTTSLTLEIIAKTLATSTFNKETMRHAAEKGYANATDLADYLVNKGVAFRDSHEITGKLVQLAIQENKTLSELTLQQYQKFSKKITKDIYQYLSLEAVVDRRQTIGATSAKSVRQTIRQLKQALSEKI